MRQEDKEIDGPELEQAEERKRQNELVEEKEDELHDLDGQPEHAVDSERAGVVIDAMKRILEGEQVSIDELELSRRHEIALEALKTASEGKDTRLSRFVYAEDRRQLLEQALAVLQPEIANLDPFSRTFEELLEDVGQLRARLNTLKDAEEEDQVIRHHEEGKDATDEDDKPDDDEDEDGTEEMTGFEETVPPTRVTTLGDPEEIFGKPRGPA